MGTRLELHQLLVAALGNSHVYYQPPESVKLEYPAIVYHRDTIDSEFANNKRYNKHNCYTLTLITRAPDSPVIDSILELPLTSYNRHYATEGLYHDMFTIYF